MKTTYNKSEIFTEAWTMFKEYNEYEYSVSFSECLKTAWNLAKGVIISGINSETEVKDIKEVVYMNTNSMDWEFVLITVKNNSNGFQKDIATKALNGFSLSEKQSWCLAYEFKNIA